MYKKRTSKSITIMQSFLSHNIDHWDKTSIFLFDRSNSFASRRKNIDVSLSIFFAHFSDALTPHGVGTSLRRTASRPNPTQLYGRLARLTSSPSARLFFFIRFNRPRLIETRRVNNLFASTRG